MADGPDGRRRLGRCPAALVDHRAELRAGGRDCSRAAGGDWMTTVESTARAGALTAERPRVTPAPTSGSLRGLLPALVPLALGAGWAVSISTLKLERMSDVGLIAA